MRSLRETIEGLGCCADGKYCEDCPYMGAPHCEDAVKEDAREWLREYEAQMKKEAEKKC